MTKKYYVDEEELEEDEFWSRLEEEVCSECEENFNDYLDEIEDEVEIFGETFSASSIMEEMSPTTYRCMLVDYQSEKYDEYKDEVERYGYLDINHSSFEIKEEDEDEDEEISED